jgi:hypothetical protein
MLNECLSLAVPRDVITDFLVADARHFLRATAQHRVQEQSSGSPGHSLKLILDFAGQADAHAASIRDFVISRSHDFVQEKGTAFERRLKWVARRPAVTIAGFGWLAVTSLWGHVEMLRWARSMVIKLWRQ